METLTSLLSFERQFFIGAIAIILSIILEIVIIIKKRHKEKLLLTTQQIDQPIQPEKDISRKLVLTYIYVAIIDCIFVGLYIWWVVNQLTSTPKVIQSNPSNKSLLTSFDSPITIVFDKPVDFNKLTTHIAPRINGEWKYHKYLNILPFGRSVTFSPDVSFKPNEHVLVYAANIRGLLQQSFGSEYSLEFDVNHLPTVIFSTPSNNTTDVPSQTTIVLTLSDNDSPASSWDFDIAPKQFFTIKRTFSHTLEIQFTSPLKQGTSYTLNVYQSPARYNIKTKQTVEISDPIHVHTLSFTTVRPPFISSFSPQKDSVLPDENISIEFDRPMNMHNVEQSMLFTPDFNRSYEWNASHSALIIRPKQLTIDTSYTLTLPKGIQTDDNGLLEEDIEFHFKTVGPLVVTDNSIEKNTNHYPVDKPISLTFNQPVDKDSFANSMVLTPNVQTTLTWKQNTVTITPKQNLLYQTSYTITIPQGTKSAFGLSSDSDYSLSFTTTAQEHIIDVPFFRQQERFTCNIAALRMLLSYRGVSVDENALKNNIGSVGNRGDGNPHKNHVANYGTYWEPIISEANKYRPTRLFTNWSLDELLKKVEANKPVMIWGQNGWSDPHDISWTATDGTYIHAINGMHSYVIRGFRGTVTNPTHIFVNDPWRGQETLPINEFNRRWKYFMTAIVLD